MTNPPHLTNPTQIWQTPPIYDKSPLIWQIPTRSDKSNWTEFVTGVCRIWAPIYWGSVMKYVANNYDMGFVTKVCHLWGVSPYWQIPHDFDKPQLMTVEVDRLSSRPMRGLENDDVTPFRPITRLDFRIFKILRGTPYQNIRWGLSYMGGVCQYLFATYFMTLPQYIGAHIWQTPPIYDKPPHIWQIPPRYDKPHPYMTNPPI